MTKLLPDGSTAWLVGLGGTSTEKSECITVDNSTGRVYVGGQFSGAATFASTNLTAVGGNDGFVACFEANGSFVWVRQIGGSGDEAVFDLKIASDGLHVCGNYNPSASWGATTFPTTSGTTSMFLIRADLDGVPVASTYVATTQGIQPNALVVLADGARVVAGQYTGSVFFPGDLRGNNGLTDLFVVAFEANGTMRWVITGGGNDFDEVISLIPSSAGGLILGASMGGGGQIADVNGNQSIPVASAGMIVGKVSTTGVYTPFLSYTGPQMGGLTEGKRGVLHVAANFSASVNLGTTTVDPPGSQASVFVASYRSAGELAGLATVSSDGYTGLLGIASTSDDGLALAGLATTSFKYNSQSLATGNSGLNAYTLLLSPPAMQLKIAKQSTQAHVTYPVYYFDAALWESSTLANGSWTQVAAPATQAVGEMQKDFDASAGKNFLHLRWATP